MPGAIAETVTISGQGPVVDVATTAAATNFTKETLDNAPVVMTMWQVLAMTPGIRFTSTPDVGRQHDRHAAGLQQLRNEQPQELLPPMVARFGVNFRF